MRLPIYNDSCVHKLHMKMNVYKHFNIAFTNRIMSKLIVHVLMHAAIYMHINNILVRPFCIFKYKLMFRMQICSHKNIFYLYKAMRNNNLIFIQLEYCKWKLLSFYFRPYYANKIQIIHVVTIQTQIKRTLYKTMRSHKL